MRLQPSSLPSSHQLPNISLETGDLQASLGTYHPFKKALWGALSESPELDLLAEKQLKKRLYSPWLMGTQ